MENKKQKTMKVNFKICGIISLIVGVIYIVVGMYLWERYLEDWGVVMAIEGIVFECLSFGLFTKHIIPHKKGAFFIGLILGIFGVIIALITKHKENKSTTYKGNKYEDLEKLQKLRENNVITDAEFEIEKAKILK